MIITADIDRESIEVACRYAMRSVVGEPVTRAEFIAQWSQSLQNPASHVWDEAHKAERGNTPAAHLAIQQHLSKIGARSMDIEAQGPDNSILRWYSMRDHIVIFQAFSDDDRWEIYTSLSSGNKILLEDACSALTSLAAK